jgi:hypothetical protein
VDPILVQLECASTHPRLRVLTALEELEYRGTVQVSESCPSTSGSRGRYRCSIVCAVSDCSWNSSTTTFCSAGSSGSRPIRSGTPPCSPRTASDYWKRGSMSEIRGRVVETHTVLETRWATPMMPRAGRRAEAGGHANRASDPGHVATAQDYQDFWRGSRVSSADQHSRTPSG